MELLINPLSLTRLNLELDDGMYPRLDSIDPIATDGCVFRKVRLMRFSIVRRMIVADLNGEICNG